MPVLPDAAPLLGAVIILLGIAFSTAEPSPESPADLNEIAARASLG